MSIKFYLYIFIVPITIWTLISINLEKYVKKGSITQIKIFYLLLTFSISYLVVNFLYDFYIASQILK